MQHPHVCRAAPAFGHGFLDSSLLMRIHSLSWLHMATPAVVNHLDHRRERRHGIAGRDRIDDALVRQQARPAHLQAFVVL
jgi:hypothetical protein